MLNTGDKIATATKFTHNNSKEFPLVSNDLTKPMAQRIPSHRCVGCRYQQWMEMIWEEEEVRVRRRGWTAARPRTVISDYIWAAVSTAILFVEWQWEKLDKENNPISAGSLWPPLSVHSERRKGHCVFFIFVILNLPSRFYCFSFNCFQTKSGDMVVKMWSSLFCFCETTSTVPKYTHSVQNNVSA